VSIINNKIILRMMLQIIIYTHKYRLTAIYQVKLHQLVGPSFFFLWLFQHATTWRKIAHRTGHLTFLSPK